MSIPFLHLFFIFYDEAEGASSGIWRMSAASETTAAIGLNAAGEVYNIVPLFGQDACSENAYVAVLAVEVDVTIMIL